MISKCQANKIANPYTDSKNIQSRYRNGIWHRKMCHVSNEKREMSHDRRNHHHHHHVALVARISLTLSCHSDGTTKSRKNQNAERKETSKYLGILEADTIKQVEMKEKIKKRVYQENQKATWDETIWQESYQRDKYLGCDPSEDTRDHF